MKFHFFGVGSAFCTSELYQSNPGMYANNGEMLLLDAGGDIRHSLREQDKTLADIKNIYISHLHNDHIGGLEGLALMTYFNPTIERPKMYAVKSIITRLWPSLKAGLETLENLPAKMDNFFDVVKLEGSDLSFDFHGIKCDPVQTTHVYSNRKIMDNFGLFFTDESGFKVFWTADCQYLAEGVQMHFYREADLILQDCETSQFQSGVHAHFDQLKQLPPEIKRKMALYHYEESYTRFNAEKEGFIGFIKKGQVLSIEANGEFIFDATL